jgi:hypothetical protein
MRTMSRRLAFSIASVLAAAAVAACGTITGLSDDYKYDLADGASSGGDGSTPDGAGDGASGDAGSDALPSFDAGGTCNPSQANNFHDYVNGLPGNAECKACIAASQCCLTVAACQAAGGGNCKNRFECDLECTAQQSAPQRLTCLNTTCPTQDPTTSTTWVNVARCVNQDCSTKCGQW